MATFDIPNTLRRELDQLGCPSSTFAKLAGFSSARLSHFMNGQIVVPGPDELRLRRTLAKLKAHAEMVRPLPLNFSKAAELETLLKKVEDEILRIVVYEESEIEATETQRQQ